jgi:hypothetical protein
VGQLISVSNFSCKFFFLPDDVRGHVLVSDSANIQPGSIRSAVPLASLSLSLLVSASQGSSDARVGDFCHLLYLLCMLALLLWAGLGPLGLLGVVLGPG